mgnify:CR=1 FL=1
MARATRGSGCSSWPTARANEAGGYQYDKGNPSVRRDTLEGAALKWPTPTVGDSGDRGGDIMPRGNLTLAGMGRLWATPTTRDGRDGANFTVETNSLLSRQAPRICDGEPFSTSGQDSRPRLLNPSFVEWLMGWDEGWTSLAPSG